MANVTYQVRPAYPSNVGGTIYVDNSRTYDVGAALVAGSGTITVVDTDTALLQALDGFLPIYRTSGLPGGGASTTHSETIRLTVSDVPVAGQVPIRSSDGTWSAGAVSAIAAPKATAINGAGSTTTSATPSTSTTLVASNAARVQLTVTNTHATADVWLAEAATATVGAGILLAAGAPPYVNPGTYTGAVSVISTTASVPLAFSQV